MLFKETVPVHTENHTKIHTETDAGLLNVKKGGTHSYHLALKGHMWHFIQAVGYFILLQVCSSPPHTRCLYFGTHFSIPGPRSFTKKISLEATSRSKRVTFVRPGLLFQKR